MVWDLLVYDDRIHNPWHLTFMVKYEVHVNCLLKGCKGRHDGLVVERRTPEREVGGSILTQVAVCCVLEQDIFTSQKY